MTGDVGVATEVKEVFDKNPEYTDFQLVNMMTSRMEQDARARGDKGEMWQVKVAFALFRKLLTEAHKPPDQQKIQEISVEGLFNAEIMSKLVAEQE